MQAQTLALVAGGVLLWFVLAFVTRTWVRQWIAAGVAGIAVAAIRYNAMLDVAATQGLAPMSPLRFGVFAVAGMLLLAAAGMGLYLLLQSSRRG